ncbi:phage tail domain-containing protein, partial [Paenibacillus larvae]
MRTIIISGSNGTIKIGSTGDYILFSVEGEGSPHSITDVQSVPQMDGAFFLGNRMDMRTISVSGVISAQDERGIYDRRTKLLRTLNAKTGAFKLYHTAGGITRVITCYIDNIELPNRRHGQFQKFNIDVICPRVCFQSIMKSKSLVNFAYEETI